MKNGQHKSFPSSQNKELHYFCEICEKYLFFDFYSTSRSPKIGQNVFKYVNFPTIWPANK